MIDIYVKHVKSPQRKFILQVTNLFENAHVPYTVHHLERGAKPLTREQLQEMSSYCMYGVLDLVGARNKTYQKYQRQIMQMSYSEYLDFLVEHQIDMLHDVIMFNGGFITTGLGMEEISSFIRMARRQRTRSIKELREKLFQSS